MTWSNRDPPSCDAGRGRHGTPGRATVGKHAQACARETACKACPGIMLAQPHARVARRARSTSSGCVAAAAAAPPAACPGLTCCRALAFAPINRQNASRAASTPRPPAGPLPIQYRSTRLRNPQDCNCFRELEDHSFAMTTPLGQLQDHPQSSLGSRAALSTLYRLKQASRDFKSKSTRKCRADDQCYALLTAAAAALSAASEALPGLSTRRAGCYQSLQECVTVRAA